MEHNLLIPINKNVRGGLFNVDKNNENREKVVTAEARLHALCLLCVCVFTVV